MTEKERNASLAEQIDLARKYIEELPLWLRSASYFAGTDHAENSEPSDDNQEGHAQAADQDQQHHCA